MHLFRRHAVKDHAAALVPVIDYGPYFAGASGVPQTIIDRGFAASRRFHALPLAEKLKLRLNENNIGYLPMNASVQAASTVHQATKPNQNESFFISHDRGADHPDVLAGIPLRGRNKWPDGTAAGLATMRADMMAYFAALHALGQRMLPPFAVALGMPEDHFAPYFANEAHANCRFLHYPPQPDSGENTFGTAPHTDNSFMTALARTDVPGLAIRLPSGEWFAPPVIPGTFLINLGNMMRRWSNNRFLATPHGVINESETDRYSIAYFHSPNPDVVIDCLPSCVSADNPAQYEPAVYRDLILAFFRANYFHQQGHKSEAAAMAAAL